MAKIKANSPCPCGSGKKYKKCCKRSDELKASTDFKKSEMPEHLRSFLEKTKVSEIIRKQQQGLGRPIIAAEFNGFQTVAVKNRLYYSTQWKTFPDFLSSFLPLVMGKEWWQLEAEKKVGRHPILIWHDIIVADFNKKSSARGNLVHTTANGALNCFLGLAYSLYLLNHNVELQEIYINRLKDVANFQGTYYELLAANCLIRSGFKLELEDETNENVKHCEFTAVSPNSGKKFWVEAKSRAVVGIFGKDTSNGTTSTDPTSSLSMHVKKALLKPAAGERIIFVDVNAPNGEINPPAWISRAAKKLEAKEKDLKSGEAAYVFVTNINFHWDLEGIYHERSFLAYGLGINDFAKPGMKTLRQRYTEVQKHRDAINILDAVKSYSKLPQTFNGELPSEKFGKSEPIKIGERYFFADLDEGFWATVTTATVDEKNKKILVGTDKGKIISRVMSDDQLLDYKNHKDVFFGKVVKQGKTINGPFELFEQLVEIYSDFPLEKLQSFCKGILGDDDIKKLTQQEAVFTYCEQLVAQIHPNELKG